MNVFFLYSLRFKTKCKLCNYAHDNYDNNCIIFSTADSTLQSINTKLANLNTMATSQKQATNEFRAEVKRDVNTLREDLNPLKESVSEINTCLQEHKLYMAGELNDLQSSRSNQTHHLKYKIEALNQTIFHHQIQLTQLQTSLNSTHSKLDSLTATTAQLSSDHQQIQANISDVERLDTEQSLELHQNMQNNLTHQLEKILDDVTNILQPYTCGGTEGWRRVVYLDTTENCTTCPSG